MASAIHHILHLNSLGNIYDPTYTRADEKEPFRIGQVFTTYLHKIKRSAYYLVLPTLYYPPGFFHIGRQKLYGFFECEREVLVGVVSLNANEGCGSENARGGKQGSFTHATPLSTLSILDVE